MTELEEAITHLTHFKLSRAALLKWLRVVISAFAQYLREDAVECSPRLVPCCLLTVPLRLKQLLKITTPLRQPPPLTSHRLLCEQYLKSQCKALLQQTQLQNSVNDTALALVRSVHQSIDIYTGFTLLRRKCIKYLVSQWGTCTQNLPLALWCFLTIRKYIHCLLQIPSSQQQPHQQKALNIDSKGKDQQHSKEKDNGSKQYMWCLRRCYVTYYENASHLNWRNLEHIRFMANCFCELVNIEASSAYYVLFGYLRSFASEITKLNSLSKKQRIEHVGKLYSVQTLNSLRLLVQTQNCSEELSGLAYPTAELLAIYAGISEQAQYMVMKVHLVQCMLLLMEHTGVYLPNCLLTLTALVSAPLFQSPVKKSAATAPSFHLIVRLNTQHINSATVNALFTKIINLFYRWGRVVETTAAASEVLFRAVAAFKPLSLNFSGHKIALAALVRKFKQDAIKLYRVRAKRQMLVTNSKRVANFETFLNKCSLQVKTESIKIKQEEEELFKMHIRAETAQKQDRQHIKNHDQNYNQPQQKEDENNQEIENQDSEVNQEWESNGSGASSFVEEEDEHHQQNAEDVQYEGDPQNSEQANRLIEQWSQKEWSSQGEIQQDARQQELSQ